jgi:hypothetical protein
MAYQYDFKAAAANKAQARETRQMLYPGQSVAPDEPVGRLFPWVLGYENDARQDPDQLLRASELGLVHRILWQLVNTILYKREIKINPPEDVDPKTVSDKAVKIQRQIKKLDTLYQVKTLMKQGWIDTVILGSAFKELGIPYIPDNKAASLQEVIDANLPWPKIDGWKAPAFAEYRDATSFTIWPPGIAPIGPRWISGRILKGVVYDSTLRNMQYWQSFHNFIVPVQIPTARVMHVKDQVSRYVDGESYLAGVLPSIVQQDFTRKVMMLAVKRWGAGVVGIKVGTLKNAAGVPITAADPEGKGRSRQTVANLWADNLLKTWDSSNAFKLLEEHELVFPPNRIGSDTTKPDEYFKKEILQHLIARDFIEQNNGAMSASSDPLIDFFMLVVNSWRPIVTKPWEQMFNAVLGLNGFEGWTMEYVMETPDFRDSNSKHVNSLAALQAHAISLARFCEETNRPAPTEEERAQILEEAKFIGKAATPQMPFGQGEAEPVPPQQNAAKDDVEEPAMELLKMKSKIAIEELKHYGYSLEP